MTFSHRARILPVLCLALSIAGPVAGQDKPPDDDGAVPVSQGGESRPYLDAQHVPDMSRIVPAPPALGTPGAEADRAIFLATRSLKDTPRWALASRDADAKPKALLRDFGCAIGADLDKTATPVLDRLLHRVLGDVEVAFRTAKADVKRLRPLVGNTEPLCVPRTERLETTYSYPSGHATRGWTFALILAELVPDHATEILTRGRVYGESRVVCGAHWASDVEAGRTVAGALVATLHGNAEFRSDLDQARLEVNKTATSAVVPDPAECRIEADAATTSLR